MTNERNKTLAVELRKWLSQSRFQSIAEFARGLGIKKSTMRDYFLGRSFPTGENLRKISESTDLDVLKRSVPSRAFTGELGLIGKLAVSEAEKTCEILVRLKSCLEYFKKGTAEDRKIFRNKVPKSDVGYLITLLKALFDEDEFQNWIFFTEYKGGYHSNDKGKP